MGNDLERSATRHRVIIVQRALRRYREEFYGQLRTTLEDGGVRLRVLHSTPPPDRDPRDDPADIPWAERLPRRDIAVGTKSLVLQPYAPALAGADLVITEQAADLMLNYALLARQAMGGPRVALWGHGRNFETTRTSNVGERIKRWFSTKPHWWFAYNDQTAQIVRQFGFPGERITVVRNATDTRSLAAAVDRFDDRGRRTAAASLGLRGDNTALFVGTFVPRKRLGFLFAATDRIRNEIPDFELVMVGSGPSAEEAEQRAASRPWVRTLGQVPYGELPPLFALAKVLLVPGWVGLVAVDSFAAGLPLVTSASGQHPPEVSYIRSGVNGLVVNDGGNPDVYADEVVRLLRDEPARRKLVDGCLEERSEYTVETMVQRFADGIAAALAARA